MFGLLLFWLGGSPADVTGTVTMTRAGGSVTVTRTAGTVTTSKA